MLKDRYDLPLTTASSKARDAYVAGVDKLLSASAGTEADFRAAIAADEGFAAAHIALARTLQISGRGNEVKAPLARARELAPSTTPREQSQINILGLICSGQGAAGLEATREHIKHWPRDAMTLAPSTSVFGLIGFSGKAGREQDQLAILEPLVTHYGDDWWFQTVYAFAEIELGLIERGRRNIEAAMAQFPRNAHGAHIKSHMHYEAGERTAGLAYLKDWARDYPREGQIHCHVSWHLALWSMETGNTAQAWEIYARDMQPGAAWGPQLNVLTDCASFLHRAEIAGEPRRPELWRDLSVYAAQWFPKSGVAFADIHAALAHAMTGDGEALAHFADEAKGPAADIVAPVARAFGHYAKSDWASVIAELQPYLATHERLGGSRAQRDLIEYTLTSAMLKAGQIDAARRLIATRRPQNGPRNTTGQFPVAGLA
ncbi:MAG: tetratricopeptide repeat protein [Hyphomicrobiaceae bacterium]